MDSSPLTRMRKYHLSTLLVLMLIVLITAWSLVSWTWSPIDDAGHVSALRDEINQRGLAMGLAQYGYSLLLIDLAWGLFRPSYWLSTPLMYTLTPSMLHVIRLIMFLTAIIGPLVYMRRSNLTPTTLMVASAFLLIGSATLIHGLYLPSLQELSGAALVGLGLMAKRDSLRTFMWLAAALFKIPFSWLLLGWGLVLWRKGKRRLALTSWLLALATLGTAFSFAQSGTYSSGYEVSLVRITSNIAKLASPWLLLLVVAVLWWRLLSGAPFKLTPMAPAFAVGAVGYAGMMLPWSTTGYYSGPFLFLASVTFVLMLTNPKPDVGVRIVAALAIPLTLAFAVVGWRLNQGLQLNSAMLEMEDCLGSIGNSSSSMIVGTLDFLGTTETAVRLEQAIRLSEPDWSGSISHSASLTNFSLDSFDIVVGLPQTPIDLPGWTRACETDVVKIFVAPEIR